MPIYKGKVEILEGAEFYIGETSVSAYLNGTQLAEGTSPYALDQDWGGLSSTPTGWTLESLDAVFSTDGVRGAAEATGTAEFSLDTFSLPIGGLTAIIVGSWESAVDGELRMTLFTTDLNDGISIVADALGVEVTVDYEVAASDNFSVLDIVPVPTEKFMVALRFDPLTGEYNLRYYMPTGWLGATGTTTSTMDSGSLTEATVFAVAGADSPFNSAILEHSRVYSVELSDSALNTVATSFGFATGPYSPDPFPSDYILSGNWAPGVTPAGWTSTGSTPEFVTGGARPDPDVFADVISFSPTGWTPISVTGVTIMFMGLWEPTVNGSTVRVILGLTSGGGDDYIQLSMYHTGEVEGVIYVDGSVDFSVLTSALDVSIGDRYMGIFALDSVLDAYRLRGAKETEGYYTLADALTHGTVEIDEVIVQVDGGVVDPPYGSFVLSEMLMWDYTLSEDDFNAVIDEYGFTNTELPSGDFPMDYIYSTDFTGLAAPPSGWELHPTYSETPVYLTEGTTSQAEADANAVLRVASFTPVETSEITVAIVYRWNTGVSGLAGVSARFSEDEFSYFYVAGQSGSGATADVETLDGGAGRLADVVANYDTSDVYMAIGRLNLTMGTISVRGYSGTDGYVEDAGTTVLTGPYTIDGLNADASSDFSVYSGRGVIVHALLWDRELTDGEVSAVADFFGLVLTAA